ncbi:MAG TPA: glycosyltransferase, partial [Gemmatimonadales bacterium]|nr:glycosyltransferase [Gemmatimonadales bacterium]
MNVAYVVHRFAEDEGTGRYTVELVRRVAPRHRVTLYAAEIAADVPPGVTVVKVPAVMTRAYTAILSFPAAFRLVRRAHDLVHAQGWVTSRADVVTAHIVLAAWRAAAQRAGVRSAAGERVLGGFVAGRERELLRRARAVIAPSRGAAEDIARFAGRREGVQVIPHGFRGWQKGQSGRVAGWQEARKKLGL